MESSETADKLGLRSTQVREQSKNMVLTIIGAVLLAFLIGIASTTAFVALTSGQVYWDVLIPTIILSFVTIYGLFYFYVFLPSARIDKFISVQILFNRKKAAILEDVFDGYIPQQIAHQIFRKFAEISPNLASEEIMKGIDLRNSQRKPHILTELVSFLVFRSIRDMSGFGETKVKADKTAALPEALRKNKFVSFYEKLNSNDPADKWTRDPLNFVLPSDVNVRYSDPASIPNFVQDPDTFEYRFDGKVCSVRLQSQMTGLTQITGLTVGPATSFRGVYIRKYWRDKLVKDFGFIWSVSFRIRITARFKLRRGYLSYLDSASSWIESCSAGSFGLDFGAFQQRKSTELLSRIFEAVSTLNQED